VPPFALIRVIGMLTVSMASTPATLAAQTLASFWVNTAPAIMS